MTKLSLLYQQYYEPSPCVYKLSKIRKCIDTEMKGGHDITLMLILNREACEKINEDDLLYNLQEVKRQDRIETDRLRNLIKKDIPKQTKIFDDFSAALPFMKEYVYVGKHTLNPHLTENEKKENEKNKIFFNKYWKDKGLQPPLNIQYNCICCKDIVKNYYIFNTKTLRLYIIGSECIKRFQLGHKCQKCKSTMTIDKYLRYDGICKTCNQKS